MAGARSQYDVRMRLVCASSCPSTSVPIGRIPRCAEERVVVLIKRLWTRWLEDQNQGIRLNELTLQPRCSLWGEGENCEVHNNFLRKRERSNTRMLFALVPHCSDWGTWEMPLRMLFFHAHTNHVLATGKKNSVKIKWLCLRSSCHSLYFHSFQCLYIFPCGFYYYFTVQETPTRVLL